MKLRRFIKKNIMYILLVLLFFILSRIFIINLATGSSMEPSILSPSILLVNRLDRKFGRFDIIVCRQNGKTITKRIIGLPGESITVTEDGSVIIDHVLLQDPYGNITFPMYLEGNRNYPVVLAQDEYFVMGDSRNISEDSRHEEIGNIKEGHIIGKVMNKKSPLS